MTWVAEVATASESAEPGRLSHGTGRAEKCRPLSVLA
jgi:hypothetical protein